jgi:hypothetical protein
VTLGLKRLHDFNILHRDLKVLQRLLRALTFLWTKRELLN